MREQNASGNARSRIYRKVDIRILGFFAVCYVTAYIDRVNISFAKLAMQTDLGWSEAVYGLGAGIFFLGYIAFEVPSNLRLTRVGARLTLSRIMVLWGLTSIATMFATHVTTFYVLRFLLGVFEAGFAPGMLFCLTRWYPQARMARATAMLLCAGPVGAVIGGPVSMLVMTQLAGAHGLAGWQWLFLLEGLPAVLLGVVLFFTLSERPADAKWLSENERAILLCELASAPCAASRHTAFREVLKDPRIHAMAFSYFAIICGLYAISFWLPTLLRSAGVENLLHIGALTALPYLAAIVAMLVIGRLSDKRRERRRHSAIALLLSAAALAGNVLAGDRFVVAMVALVAATALMYASYAVFWAIPVAYLRGDVAAGGIALINSIGLFGGFVSPTVIGWIKTATGSLQAGLMVMAALFVAGAIVLLANRVDANQWSAAAS
ncbi:MFS transporter [Burkholderia humptydooensis]|uniref:MFS transporter n=2 Tax=Burkholderia humptydooensis TaxID=430531 RepID=A0A7U4PC34_9BURK|nr:MULTISPECIES: MFS transporter [Burkholderia]AJY40434.1 major Facilitator Superfamily protein [Burkholderia sp. 2002721687]ALX46767.1 MFS transporter [Burkholderia humptydooensis]EIP86221.1 major facilitator family transporter [Burkholderia humptydooensis MSMB43]QPS46081.1 MFS transporter [Burkholderia humptydooensis]